MIAIVKDTPVAIRESTPSQLPVKWLGSPFFSESLSLNIIKYYR